MRSNVNGSESRMKGKLNQTQKGHFSYLRELKVFNGNELHIVKPLNLRHWTRTAALSDADEIAGAILSGGRVE